MKRIILILAVSLTGCARYYFERPVAVPIVIKGKTNIVAGIERTGVWSLGSKTGFKGITSDTIDGTYRRRVGADAVETKGDNDLAESIARGASQGSGVASLTAFIQLLQSAQSATPAVIPTNATPKPSTNAPAR